MTDTSKEAVERWHEETEGLVSGEALYEGQQEYVLYRDYAALQAQLEYWQNDSAAAWDKCEENRLRSEALEAQLAAARADADRYRYVLGGVRDAIKTGRNEPLMVWRDQIDIVLLDHPAPAPTPSPDDVAKAAMTIHAAHFDRDEDEGFFSPYILALVREYEGDTDQPFSHSKAHFFEFALRALSDPDTLAAIIKTAGGEKNE